MFYLICDKLFLKEYYYIFRFFFLLILIAMLLPIFHNVKFFYLFLLPMFLEQSQLLGFSLYTSLNCYS